MATDAIIVLERLRCFVESDGTGDSEPYIWPVLIWIDDDTIATPALVGVKSLASVNARIVIKANMRAGQVADIPVQVGTLRVRLDDDQQIQQLILAVALWESDETPGDAMRDGNKAFAKELGLAIADNLFELNPNTTTAEERKLVIDAIKLRVRGKVESAIRNGLTNSQKLRVFLGTLDLDDIVGSDFKSFDKLEPQPFRLTFASNENPPSNRYTVDGQLRAVPVVVDPCAAFVTRVRTAQGVINGIEEEIRRLQAQLSGQTREGDPPPLPKPEILADIERLKDEELPPAEEALDAARGALALCRRRQQTVGSLEGGVATTLRETAVAR